MNPNSFYPNTPFLLPYPTNTLKAPQIIQGFDSKIIQHPQQQSFSHAQHQLAPLKRPNIESEVPGPNNFNQIHHQALPNTLDYYYIPQDFEKTSLNSYPRFNQGLIP
jgi:hypothetical protein